MLRPFMTSRSCVRIATRSRIGRFPAFNKTWEEIMLRPFLIAGLSGLVMSLSATASFAADVTLKLHQMLPPQAAIPWT